jgi:hypothetical protein
MNIVTKKNAYLTPTPTLDPNNLPGSRHAVGHAVVDGRKMEVLRGRVEVLQLRGIIGSGRHHRRRSPAQAPVDRLHVQHIQHEVSDVLLVVVSTTDVILEVTGQVSTTHLHFLLTFQP